MNTARLFIAVALNGAAAVGARRREAVTAGGAVAGFTVGAGILFFGGWISWILLMVFFGSSSVLSRLKASAKDDLSVLHEKGSRRDHVQVLANGGVGLVMSVGWAATGTPLFLIAVAVSFAAANADTWASEIGVLASRRPVSILTGKPLPRGTSGGVTPLGFGASAAGSAVIAAVFTAGYGLATGWSPALAAVFAVVTAGGFLGSVIDSVLGATVQAQYADSNTGAATERRLASLDNQPNTLTRGFAAVSNDVVNAVSCVLSSAAGAALYMVAV
ncbi:MAG: DUF92 domain-containing protein [Spirochaetia bacterium]